MSIPFEVVSNILQYLPVMEVGKMDMAYTNHNCRGYFIECLRKLKRLEIRGTMLLIDKHGFIRWLRIRGMR